MNRTCCWWPVADTAKIDPFMMHTTLSLICDVRDPITKKEYSRDPRSIARKAAKFLKQTKIADTAHFGPELEFFIFDHAWYDQGINFSKHYVGSREGIWAAATRSRPTWAIRSGSRRVTSPRRRWTRCRTSAVRWSPS